jgi:hypothetical protein
METTYFDRKVNVTSLKEILSFKCNTSYCDYNFKIIQFFLFYFSANEVHDGRLCYQAKRRGSGKLLHQSTSCSYFGITSTYA